MEELLELELQKTQEENEEIELGLAYSECWSCGWVTDSYHHCENCGAEPNTH